MKGAPLILHMLIWGICLMLMYISLPLGLGVFGAYVWNTR